MKKSIYLTAACAMLIAIPPMWARYEKAVTNGGDIPSKAVTITVELPMEMTPTADDISLFTLIDANGDNKKWAYRSNFGGLVSPSNDKAACNDWAITPGLRFNDVSTNYEFSFTMTHNMRGSDFISSFEFYIGTSPDPESMTTLVGKIENFYVPVANQDVPQSVPFAVPGEAGVYYLGIRCVSPAMTDGVSPWPCTFKNLSVKAMESSAGAPMQPTDVTVTAAERGGLEATVAFTMPSISMNGKPLPESTILTAIVTSPVETKPVTALPGDPISVTLATQQGDNNISLQVNGAEQGEPMPLNVYTGVVLPMRVHDLTLTLSPDNMSATLDWTPPTEGKDGGYVDFDALEYLVYISDSSADEYRLLDNVGSELTYTYTMDEGAQLRTVRLRVLPKNAAGISTDDVNWVGQDPVTVSDMIGTPYALPAIERFDNLDMTYTPISILRPDENYAGRWLIQDPSDCVPDENQSALMAYSPYNEGSTMGRVALPKFSTKGLNNVAFSLKAMRYSSYAKDMNVYARNYTEDLTLLGTINCSGTNDWVDYSYPLPEKFQDKDWVQIIIDVNLEDVDYIYAIDQYKLAVSAATDVAMLNIATSDPLVPGKQAEFTAKLSNLGFNAVTPQVHFSATDASGKIIAEENVNVAMLKSGAETNVKWKFAPETEQIDTEITVKAEITTTDEVPSNDAAEVKIHVRRPELPVVTDLAANVTTDAVTLFWSEPVLHRTVTESFESLEDFYYGETMGNFKTFDGDGKSVYKFSNLTMPNEQLPKAFMVINHDMLNGGEGLEPHDGVKYLMATCPEMISDKKPDPANDWLISPEVEGGSYVSFFLNIISETYPETIRIMTSSTTDEPEAFAELMTLVKPKMGWQQVEFRMPKDAKYFAVNYVSHDMFGIMIDDVKFVSKDELYTIAKYNVYRDGQFIGTTTEPRYVDTAVTTGNSYTYHVTSITEAESVNSNKVTVIAGISGIDGVDTVSGSARAVVGGILFENCGNVSVHDIAGRKVFEARLAGAKAIAPVTSGIYAVTVDGRTMKLAVR